MNVPSVRTRPPNQARSSPVRQSPGSLRPGPGRQPDSPRRSRYVLHAALQPEERPDLFPDREAEEERQEDQDADEEEEAQAGEPLLVPVVDARPSLGALLAQPAPNGVWVDGRRILAWRLLPVDSARCRCCHGTRLLPFGTDAATGADLPPTLATGR